MVANSEIEDFMVRCMTKVGTATDHAIALAKCLSAADYRGHFSHGLNRLGILLIRFNIFHEITLKCCLLNKLDKYVHDIKTGLTCSSGEPKIIKESSATALVDGMNLLGPVVGNFCMSIAIKKAKESGIGMVVANRSTHYGE